MFNKRTLLFLFLLFSSIALAADTSQVNTYSNGQVLTADQLNSEFANIYSTINNLDTANLSSSAGILPTQLSATIDGDGISRQADGSLDVNVDGTTVTIVSDQLVIDDLPGTALATGAVGSAQLENGGVMKVDLDIKTTASTASLGDVALSSGTGASEAEFASASSGDLTNNSVTITTNGGPVVAQLMPATDATESYIECDDDTTDPCTLALVRDGSTTVGEIEFYTEGGELRIPPAGIKWLDAQSAGTYTYKITYNVGSATALRVLNVRLMVYEL